MKRTWRNRVVDWFDDQAKKMEIRAAKRALRHGVSPRAIASDAPTLTYEEVVELKNQTWNNGWENP